MKVTQELIGPEQAKQMLDDKYPGQRHVRAGLVKYLVKIIKEGSWQSNLPQPMMISETGRLLDGQHRCHAIIEAGRPVLCWVARNVSESVYSYIDSGKSRTLSDRVSFVDGNPYLNNEICLVAGHWFYQMHARKTRPTAKEILSLFEEHKHAIYWVASNRPRKQGIGRIQAAVAFGQMFEINKEKAVALADTVWGGSMERPNGIKFREYLILTANGKTRVSGDYLYPVSVGVCRAELEDRILTRMQPSKWNND